MQSPVTDNACVVKLKWNVLPEIWVCYQKYEPCMIETVQSLVILVKTWCGYGHKSTAMFSWAPHTVHFALQCTVYILCSLLAFSVICVHKSLNYRNCCSILHCEPEKWRHFIFDYSSGISWVILTLFVPAETGMNALQFTYLTGDVVSASRRMSQNYTS